MANLRRHGSGPYHLELRFRGRKFQRSLRTKRKAEAARLRAAVEQTIEYLDRGVLTLPADSNAEEIWRFLLSGGKVSSTDKAVSQDSPRLGYVCDEYVASYSAGSKEASTLKTEKLHLRHLRRLLGEETPLDRIETKSIEAYVRSRQGEPGIRGRTVSATTVSKELATFGLLWKFAMRREFTKAGNPARDVPKPRGNQKPAFLTYEEIEMRVGRGDLSDAEIADLWDALFLRENEIAELLAYARDNLSQLPHARYLYPALAFCAYTGARRSEMFRARIDDVNGRVIIREKKRSQSRRITFRQVPLHAELKDVLDEWLEQRPSGQRLFCKNSGSPLEDKSSRDAFKRLFRDSKWNVLRGFHVLRHSFASNLARHGTDHRIIDSWMGHQTEEMRERYRHLFPEDTEKALAVLSFVKPAKS